MFLCVHMCACVRACGALGAGVQVCVCVCARARLPAHVAGDVSLRGSVARRGWVGHMRVRMSTAGGITILTNAEIVIHVSAQLDLVKNSALREIVTVIVKCAQGWHEHIAPILHGGDVRAFEKIISESPAPVLMSEKVCILWWECVTVPTASLYRRLHAARCVRIRMYACIRVCVYATYTRHMRDVHCAHMCLAEYSLWTLRIRVDTARSL